MHDSPYMIASLAWLDALLALHIERVRLRRGGAGDDEFRGLYISEADVDALLDPHDPGDDERLAPARQAVAAAHAARAAAAGRDGGAALLRLQRLFGLTDLERDVLAICLAPEIDLRYERLFAYAQDDVTRKRPTVDLALALLCDSLGERLAAGAIFADDAPLRRQLLVHLFEDGQRHAPLLAQFLKLDERIVAELLGRPAIDGQLQGCARLVDDARALDELIFPSTLVERLRSLVSPLGRQDARAPGDEMATVIGLVGGY